MEQPSLALEAPFVDREKELGTLKTLFEQMLAGTGSTVFVAGEGGIGKTRLVREFRRYVESKGAIFVAGASYEQEGIVPYSPWIDVIRAGHKRTSSADLRKMPNWILAEIGRLVPDVLSEAQQFGLKAWLQGPSGFSIMGASDQDRIRLFQAIMDFLTGTSPERGVVIFLDDIGWADHASLQLFHYIARRAPEHRLMLIGAYRDVELPDDHPLLGVILDLNRLRRAHQISLSYFTLEYVQEMLTKHLEGQVSKDFGQLIYSRSGGNPFFVEEIVRSLMEQGRLDRSERGWMIRDIQDAEIPTTIRAVIKQRIARLGEECAQLLSIGSVMGMEFDFEVLKRVTELPEERSISLLEKALRAQVIRERKVADKVVYVFADETIHEFLVTQPSLLRRRRYHLAIAHTIEELRKDVIDDHLGELAYHFIQAAEIGKAKEYSIRAADKSTALYAHSGAIRHYTNALELVSENELETKLELLTKIAQSAYRKADHNEVVRFCGEAVETAQRLGLKTELADLHALLGLSYFLVGNAKKEALESYLKGLEVLADSEDTLQKALLLQQIGRVYVLTGEPEVGLDWLKRSIEMASKLGAHWVLAHAYQTLALSRPLKEKTSIISYLEQAFDLANEHWLDDPGRDVFGRAYDNLVANLSAVKGEYRRSLDLVLKGIDYAKKAGSPHFQAWLGGDLAFYAYLPLGEWDACERVARETISLGRELGAELYLIESYNALAFMACGRGELQKARELVNYILPIAVKSEWPEFFVRSYQAAASIHLAQNELDEAQQYLLRAFEYRAKGNTVTQAAMLEIAFGLVTVTLKRGEVDKASAYYQELVRMASELDEKWGYAIERWARGLIAEAQGNATEGMKSLRESVELWKTVERRYDLALTHMDLGRMSEKVGNNSEAEQNFNAASGIFELLRIPITSLQLKR